MFAFNTGRHVVAGIYGRRPTVCRFKHFGTDRYAAVARYGRANLNIPWCVDTYPHQSPGVPEQPSRRRLFSFQYHTAEIRRVLPSTVDAPTPPFKAAASLPTPPPPTPPSTPPADSEGAFGNLVCQRTDTITQLIEVLDRARVVNVRGTPASGKTTMALLLEDRLLQDGRKVIFLPSWPSGPAGDNYQKVLIEEASEALGLTLNRRMLDSYDIVFIIDEAQRTFINTNLWLWIKRLSGNGSTRGAQICLFTSYGSPGSGTLEPHQDTTPVHFGVHQRVGIMKSTFNHGPAFGLFYSEEEFADVMKRYATGFSSPLPFTDEAKLFLFDMTNGHPGAVHGLVYILHMKFRKWALDHRNECFTKDMLFQALDDEEVFRMLEQTPVSRSFPPHTISHDAVSVLRRVLIERCIPRDLNDVGIKACITNGWLHTEASDPTATEIFCYYPSPLHYKYAEFTFAPRQLQPFPFDKYPDAMSMCIAVIKHFSRSNLRNNSQGHYTPKNVTINTPEAQFQKEFYAAANRLLGDKVALSSEWSGNGKGRIDFKIADIRWGMELLRDGGRLEDHCKRFEPGGSYHQQIMSGHLTDWVIVDCTHTTPNEFTAVPGAKLIRVVFDDDYASATIINANNEEVASKFPLLS